MTTTHQRTQHRINKYLYWFVQFIAILSFLSVLFKKKSCDFCSNKVDATLDTTCKSRRNRRYFFCLILAHKIYEFKWICYETACSFEVKVFSKWLLYCVSSQDVEIPWRVHSLTNHQNCKSIIRLRTSYRKQRICSLWLTAVM